MAAITIIAIKALGYAIAEKNPIKTIQNPSPPVIRFLLINFLTKKLSRLRYAGWLECWVRCGIAAWH